MLVEFHFKASNGTEVKGVSPVRTLVEVIQERHDLRLPGWTLEVRRCPRVDKPEEAAVEYEKGSHEPKRSH
jgi:hypothetical protein